MLFWRGLLARGAETRVRLVAAGGGEGNVAVGAVWQIGCTVRLANWQEMVNSLRLFAYAKRHRWGVLAAIIRSGTGALPASSPVRRGECGSAVVAGGPVGLMQR